MPDWLVILIVISCGAAVFTAALLLVALEAFA